MELKEDATLLSAESRPYSVDGNEGTSHRVRLLIGGEVFSCKSTAEMVSSLQKLIGEVGEAHIKVLSRKENLSIEFVNFTPQE